MKDCMNGVLVTDYMYPGTEVYGHVSPQKEPHERGPGKSLRKQKECIHGYDADKYTRLHAPMHLLRHKQIGKTNA